MQRKVFVDYLCPTTTPEILHQLFGSAGKVESVVIPPPTEPGPVHAFVLMATDGEASNAILTLNNSSWKGTRLTVTLAGPTGRVRSGFKGGKSGVMHKTRP